MLKKLMKYEFKGLRRPFVILLSIMLAATLASCLLLVYGFRLLNVSPSGFVLLLAASMLLYYAGILIFSLGVSLSCAIHFYKTCYTDAGYLTHTLPVSAGQLAGAKTLSAIFLQLTGAVCVILTIILYAGVLLSSLQSSIDLSEVNAQFEAQLGVSLIAYCGWLAVYGVIGCVTGTCIILGCVSLGQLYTKHRVLGAIIAYFLVMMLLQVVAYISVIPMYTKILVADLAGETPLLFPMMEPTFIAVGITGLILAIVMHYVNIHMMTKRLNLR